MDESNNPDEGTASIDINEAASLISQQIDVPEDSNEQPEEHVEPTPEEVVETIEDQFFDINGEQISLNDLKTGFMKNADYTKKTQALSEERRVYQQNQRDVNEVRSQAIAGLEAIKQELAVQFQFHEQPDWDYLLENEPAEYLRQQNAWQKRWNAIGQMQEAERQLRAKEAEYEAEQRQLALQESNAVLMNRYPEWKDQSVASAGAAYVLTFTQGPTAYYKGQVFRFWIHADNTGAATLNVNSLGAKSILSTHGEALTAGQLRANRVAQVVYNGTSFELLNVTAHNPKFTGTLTANSADITTLVGNTAFTGSVNTSTINASTGNQVVINAGESSDFATGQTAEQVYINAETGLVVTSSIDNWATGWAGRRVTTITGEGITVNGGTVWASNNDGSGSGLDADLLDGQQGTYYRDLSNSTGTLPNARLNGAYDGITLSSTSVKVASGGWSTSVPVTGGLTVEGANPMMWFRQTDTPTGAFAGVNGTNFYVLGADDNTGIYSRQSLVVPLNGTDNMTYNGDTVWTAGNDGASSGLDADLLDGQHGSYYRDLTNSTGTLASARLSGSYTGIVGVGALNAGSIASGFGNINIGTATFTGNGSGLTSLNASNLSSGTLPNARISGAYDGITNLGITGALTITSSAPIIRLIDTTASSYSARLRVDSNNVYFDSSTDDVTFGEVFRFELDAKVGYVANSRLWTDAYATTAKINGIIGYTPASAGSSIVAGDGMTGGGTLAASRTLTLGTPGSITNSTTNSVTTTSHTHALGFTAAEVYTGSSLNNTNFPIGSIVLATTSVAAPDRNASATVRLHTVDGAFSLQGSETALSGTWRSKGYVPASGNGVLMQRTA